MQSPLINPLKSVLINPIINPFGAQGVPTISPANFNFSRASAAYDPLGILYPSGVPRIYGYPQRLMVEEGTTNLLPASATNTFSDVSQISVLGGATRAQDNTVLFGGKPTLKVITSASAASGISVAGLTAGTKSGKWIVKGSAGAIITVQFGAVPANITLSGGWDEIKQENATIGANLTFALFTGFGTSPSASQSLNIAWMTAESKAYCTSVIDTNRAAEVVTVPGSYLNPAQGTIEILCNMNAVTKRQVSGQYNILITMPRVSNPSLAAFTIYHSATAANFTFNTYDDSSNVTTTTFNDPPDGITAFAISFDAISAKVYINGSVVATINNPKLPSSGFSTIYPGQNNGFSYMNTAFYDMCLSSSKRTDLDIASRAAFAQANGYFPNDGNVTWKLKR